MKYYFQKNNRSKAFMLVECFLLTLFVVVSAEAGCQERLFECYSTADQEILSEELREIESRGLDYNQGEVEILDYFVLSGSLKSVNILIDNEAVPDQSNKKTLEYLLTAISSWDAGIIYGSEKRIDFLEILRVLIEGGADYDFHSSGMHFVENFIVYYCRSGIASYGMASISRVTENRGKVRYSTLKNMDNIENAAVQGLYSMPCIEGMKSVFLKD